MCCIRRIIRYDLDVYVGYSLSKETYIKTYNSMIHPIPDEALWPEVIVDHVMPLIVKRKPGRPKVLKRRKYDELEKEKRSYTLKCGICKAIRHNKRSCPKSPANLKRKRNEKDNAAGTTLIAAAGTTSTSAGTTTSATTI